MLFGGNGLEPAAPTVWRNLFHCNDLANPLSRTQVTNDAKAILKAFAKYRKGTPFEPDEPDQELCVRLREEILAAGVFTQRDAADFVNRLVTGTDAQVQFAVGALRTRFQAKFDSLEDRKTFIYLLARFVKSFHFLTCFFTYSDEFKEFATFAEYVGPQLIKHGSVSELMKQIRQTEVVKAAVEYRGEVRSGDEVNLKPGKGKKGSNLPPKKVSVQDMIEQIRAKFDISDEEALYIKQVIEEKAVDPAIRQTVHIHREDSVYLEGTYRGQVNGEIQDSYEGLARYEELADPKYSDTGGIFDIMAVTVIQSHLMAAA